MYLWGHYQKIMIHLLLLCHYPTLDHMIYHCFTLDHMIWPLTWLVSSTVMCNNWFWLAVIHVSCNVIPVSCQYSHPLENVTPSECYYSFSCVKLEPSVTGEQAMECHDKDSETEGDTLEQSTGPIGDDLVTLSSLPKSRWHTLAHIDIIKVQLPVHTMCIHNHYGNTVATQ